MRLVVMKDYTYRFIKEIKPTVILNGHRWFYDESAIELLKVGSQPSKEQLSCMTVLLPNIEEVEQNTREPESFLC